MSLMGSSDKTRACLAAVLVLFIVVVVLRMLLLLLLFCRNNQCAVGHLLSNSV